MVECSVCHTRSSVGECKSCERHLCEVCGIPCQRCHKLVCREHRSLTPGGRNLCPECMEHREWKRRRKAEEEAARAEGGTGFQALMGDLGEDLPGQAAEMAPEPLDDYRPDWAGEAPAPPPPREVRPQTLEDELNARVLTGSGAEPRPLWINSAVAGTMACLMLLFAPRLLQPGISYLIMLVGLGAVVFGISGYRRRQDSDLNRKLSWIGTALGAVAIVAAFVML